MLRALLVKLAQQVRAEKPALLEKAAKLAEKPVLQVKAETLV
jgi:hypothetical protein